MEKNRMFSKLTEAQKQFFETGRTRDLAFRICQLQLLADAMRKNETVLEEALKKDLGKSAFESYATEIGFVLADIRYTIQNLQKWSAPKRVRTPLYLFPGKSKIQKEPYGSVLILGPYNYPVQLLAEPLVGAIAAGNCAVLKPSELTPHVSEAMYQIVHSTFKEEYIACVEGGVEVNQELLSQKFDYIFFTGSERVGRIVMKAAAENLTPVTLELGGKSPVIIEKTANIKEAARRIAWGKLMNAGQTCVAPDYVLVDESRKQQFLTEMKTAFSHLYGKEIKKNPDFGRIVNERHMERLQKILEQDAKYLFCGGEADTLQRYIEPAILDLGKDQNAASMQEELFGPILPVLSYHKLEDAVRFVNKRAKPLALYLFTKKRSAEKFVLERVSSGGVCVNDTISHLINPDLPFGGVGASGMGQYHGKYSFDTFTHEKSVFYKPADWNLPVCYPPFTKGKMNLVKFFLK
ncbi:aldehyde dehydrogenase [[Ruminococcus] gnavus]|jgi:aldehyde dehydrogenase (NAD+)|uniref:Aldehyde dehydrogenase n=3 Tax=Bacteria TaxID=2 RepID=A0A414CTS3_MEDGN|nr:aldehyde dehydrogenase [Mediterraneibacter gnavus]RGQ63313.1 aldehyde dehydrogenase [Mediterraneibacter gnavus]RHC98701.1 aldehyde dehydrogenase [Mediterraneibacter gnavus]RHH38827.1 aldehyde dehydrogenase [Mediterraneibacter gnavus]